METDFLLESTKMYVLLEKHMGYNILCCLPFLQYSSMFMLLIIQQGVELVHIILPSKWLGQQVFIQFTLRWQLIVTSVFEFS